MIGVLLLEYTTCNSNTSTLTQLHAEIHCEKGMVICFVYNNIKSCYEHFSIYELI